MKIQMALFLRWNVNMKHKVVWLPVGCLLVVGEPGAEAIGRGRTWHARLSTTESTTRRQGGLRLDLEQGTAPGDTGPFQWGLYEHGQNGRVAVPVMGAFAGVSTEMYLGTYAIAGLIPPALTSECG